MNLKRRLIRVLPDNAKRVLAVPYDYVQARKANHEFRRKELVRRDAAEDAPQHIVIVVVDALRGDAVTEEDTPFMASLEGTRRAITPSGWTFPAVSSLLTGEYPHQHGAIRRHDEIVEGMDLPPRMPMEKETLTEVLAGAGYRTYGGFGHDTPFVALSGRFEHHDLHHKINSDAETVFSSYLSWLRNHASERTFAYLHLADPHIPVDPPLEYWRDFDVDASIPGISDWDYTDILECDDDCTWYRDNRRRLYTAALSYVDDALNDFHQSLRNLVDDPVFVVTSDHGELLWEHQELDLNNFEEGGAVDHGGTPYEALARVPILTENIEVDVSEPVSLVDLAPSITHLVGVPDALDPTGNSLLSSNRRDRSLLVESSLEGYEKKAVYMDEWKLIVSKKDGVELGFSLPGERLAEIPEQVKQEMMDDLPPWPDEERTDLEAGAPDVGGIVEDRLEELGYR